MVKDFVHLAALNFHEIVITAPAAPHGIDHEARTALEKLLGHLKTIEQDVEHLKRIQAEKSEPKASFSYLF